MSRIRRGCWLLPAALTAALPLLAADETPKGRQYALLVGVRNYNKDELRNLDYTENDVNDLAAVLKDAGYKRVVVLTQSAAAEQRDNSLLPTAQNIRDQLTGLLEDRKPGDTVLVAFSGHGVQPRGEKGSYFCPMDAKLADPKTLISLADVYKALEECQADERLLLVDACRNDPLAGGDKGVEKVKLESVTRPPAEKPPTGVAALFSCSAGEQSYESAKYKHGIFFHYVIEGLKGAAPRNKQGEVTLEYLAGYLKDEAPDAAKDEWGPRARMHPELVGKLSGSGVVAAALLKEEITDGLGVKLKLIRPGTFLMGSPKDEAGRFLDEGPQHEVEITRPFYMGVYPITRGQFADFVKAESYTTEAEKDGNASGYDVSTKRPESGSKYSWRDPGFSQTDDHPVVNVTWNDAQTFCTWLSRKEGKSYDLPPEAQWEYACRAGTSTRFWCGDSDTSLKGNANIGDASLKAMTSANLAKMRPFVSWDDGYAFTSPVGTFKPNPWGLYDMHGNVKQWCGDGYYPYEGTSVRDPVGRNAGAHRILRGGSWGSGPIQCRSAYRNADHDPSYSDYDVGFRVVLWPDRATP